MGGEKARPVDGAAWTGWAARRLGPGQSQRVDRHGPGIHRECRADSPRRSAPTPPRPVAAWAWREAAAGRRLPPSPPTPAELAARDSARAAFSERRVPARDKLKPG